MTITANEVTASSQQDVYGLIIRLARDDPRGDSASNLREYASMAELEEIITLLEEFEIPSTRRVILSATPARVRSLELAGYQYDDDFLDLPSLNQYWHLDVRHLDEGELVQLLRALLTSSSGIVEHAYKEHQWSLPSGGCPKGADPLATEQHYLEEVAALWAWSKPGGQGNSVGVVDIETGWWLDGSSIADHQELSGHAAKLVYGDCRPSSANHGTAVLGVIAALNNGVGTSGLAPCLDRLRMASAYDAASDTAGHVADALVAAVGASEAGDVLVIEQQVGLPQGTGFPGYPAEVDEVTFLAVRVASANWRIVVEAAGNSNKSLDPISVPFPLPGKSGFQRSLDRTNTSHIDSRAIIVAAAAKHGTNGTYEWFSPSSYGSRVDCFARGSGIVTTGYNSREPYSLDRREWYSNYDLANTSASTAIVAGAAAITQGMRLAGGHPPFNWKRMRYLLSTFGAKPDPAAFAAHPFGTAMPSAETIKNMNGGWF